MYFVNCTARVFGSSVEEGDDVVVTNSGPSSSVSPPSTLPAPPSSPFAASDVPGLDMDRLRADAVLWTAYEQGWKDAYAAALAAFATVPPSPLAVAANSPLATTAVPTPLAVVVPSPLTDTRPAATGADRRRARTDRRALRAPFVRRHDRKNRVRRTPPDRYVSKCLHIVTLSPSTTFQQLSLPLFRKWS